jgi:integrase
MPRSRKIRVPSYRKHKASGLAVVSIRGKDHYLGPWGTSSSKAEYERLIAEYQANQSTGHSRGNDPADLTIAELCSRYVTHAEQYYVKRGRLTSEIHSIRKVVKTLRSLYAHTIAKDFGPLALKTTRQQWIDEGLTRGGINRLARITRTIFKWGTENELVPVATWQALTAVAGLKQGRSLAPEPDAIRPVAEDVLQKTLDAAHPMIRAMIQIQLKTGMRPGELVQLRGADLDQTGPLWVFKPRSHKLEHRGRERVIFIGPDAQTVLEPWLRDDPVEFVFGSRQLREYNLRGRPTPRPLNAKEKRSRKRRVLRDRFSTNAYLQAVRRACDRAKVQWWSPNRLRHAAATMLRARYGVEAARTVLGHSNISTTQIYAEADLEKAAKIMGEVG